MLVEKALCDGLKVLCWNVDDANEKGGVRYC